MIGFQMCWVALFFLGSAKVLWDFSEAVPDKRLMKLSVVRGVMLLGILYFGGAFFMELWQWHTGERIMCLHRGH